MFCTMDIRANYVAMVNGEGGGGGGEIIIYCIGYWDQIVVYIVC